MENAHVHKQLHQQNTHTYTCTLYRDPLDSNMTLCHFKDGKYKESDRESQVLQQGQCYEDRFGVEQLLTYVGIYRENGKHNRWYSEQKVGLSDPTNHDTLHYYPHLSPTGAVPNDIQYINILKSIHFPSSHFLQCKQGLHQKCFKHPLTQWSVFFTIICVLHKQVFSKLQIHVTNTCVTMCMVNTQLYWIAIATVNHTHCCTCSR